jgi:hypothetical protein
MMSKNCWQFKNCGREPGGVKTAELGICSATIYEQYNGKNNGKNAGRYCWKVAGTLCGGKVQGTYAQKLMNCVACDFYKAVRQEEGEYFLP